MVGCIYFKLVVAQGYDVFNACVLQGFLGLEECMQLPLRVVLGQMLIFGPRRYDADFLKYRQETRHESLSTKLHPAFACIGNNISFAKLHAHLEDFLGRNFQILHLLHHML